MARDHSRINLAIWQDDDFRDLPPAAQHLYFVLWTHPELNYAGVVDWRPGRLSGLASGWTVEQIAQAADCLEARLFIVRDDVTEECLLRSFVRFDGLMKQPHMAVAFANSYAGTASPDIRGVVVHEAIKLQKRQPDLAAWKKDQVVELLGKRSLDPRDRTLPEDPFRAGLTPPLTPTVTPTETPSVTEAQGSIQGSDEPPLQPPSTPTPSPSPSTGGGTTRRATQLPDSWKPTEDHHKRARESGVDAEREAVKFRTHCEDKGRTSKSWNAAFTTWLIKAAEYAQRDGRPPQAQRPAAPSLWDRVPNVSRGDRVSVPDE